MAGPRLSVELITPGRTACSWLKQGEEEYLKRLSRYARVEIKAVRPARGKMSDEAVLRCEAGAIGRAIRPRSLIVAMDQAGRETDSAGFASLVAGWQRDNRRVSVLIGGHLGLAQSLKQQADLLLAMSRMTFTHEMARLFFLEQLYRAFTIIGGSRYHK